MADEEAGRSYFAVLNRCFKDDPHIDELDIVPSPLRGQHEEPFILQEHKLGIKMWCVKELYEYSYKRFLEMKASLTTEDFLDLTRAVLLINTECYIAWNTRKEYCLSGKLRIEEDLKLCDLLLTLVPRSVETFIHRRWLLKQFHRFCRNDDTLESLLKHEFLVCTITADKHGANYISWSHREWLVDNFLQRNLKGLMCEWKKTEQWVQGHVSDHCGFQYRQFLLKTLRPLCDVDHFLSSEFTLNSRLILSFPGHDAVWNHRRYLIYCYLHWIKPSQECNVKESESSVNTSKELKDSYNADIQLKGESNHSADPAENDGQISLNKNTLPLAKKRKLQDGTLKLTTVWSLEEELLFCENAIRIDGDLNSQKLFAENHRKWLKNMTNQSKQVHVQES